MKILISKKLIPNAEQLLRRAGYGKIINRHTGETSYARHLDRAVNYPRFHIYIDDKGDNWSINLHLDQRAPVYSNVTAHSGEYDGEVVEGEAVRLQELAGPRQNSPPAPSKQDKPLMWG